MRPDWAGVPQGERGRKGGCSSQHRYLRRLSKEVLRDEGVRVAGLLKERQTCPADHKPRRNTPCGAGSFSNGVAGGWGHCQKESLEGHVQRHASYKPEDARYLGRIQGKTQQKGENDGSSLENSQLPAVIKGSNENILKSINCNVLGPYSTHPTRQTTPTPGKLPRVWTSIRALQPASGPKRIPTLHLQNWKEMRCNYNKISILFLIALVVFF